MTNEKHDPLADKTEVISHSRRRLTGAALAGPVVLGSLSSKQALGAVAYKCTVSGQVSNNFSPKRDDANCGILGLSPGCWKQCDTFWPSPYTSSRSATFNATFGVSIGGGNLSLIQLLSPEDYKNSKAGSLCSDTAFVRIAIASLLNATQFSYPDFYPVNAADVKVMVRAYFNGGSFTLSSGKKVTWDKSKISEYLSSLYGGSYSSPDITNTAGCPHTKIKQPGVLASDGCNQAK